MNIDQSPRFGLSTRAALAGMVVAALLFGALPSLVVSARSAEAAGARSGGPAEVGTDPRFLISGTLADGSEVEVGVEARALMPNLLLEQAGGGSGVSIIDGCSINGNFWVLDDDPREINDLTITDREAERLSVWTWPALPVHDGDAEPFGLAVGFLDTLALPTCDAGKGAVKIPKKIRGRATQVLVAGGNRCGAGFKNKFTLGNKGDIATYTRDFGRGVKSKLHEIGSDADSQSVVFRDRDPNFDALLVLWPGGATLSGILAEAPDGSFSDELARTLLGPRPEGTELQDWLDPVTSARDSCAWSSESKPDKKGRRVLRPFWNDVRPIGRSALDASETDETSRTDEGVLPNEDRFQVEVEWRSSSENGSLDGAGQVVMPDDGLFWFFNPDDPEVLVKVLDGCAINDRFWVFATATTEVEFDLTVTDTDTATARTYSNPLGEPPAAVLDYAAFATCP